MDKIALMMVSVMLALALVAGCVRKEEPPAPPSKEVAAILDTYWTKMTKDPATGCEYLIYNDRAITPILAEDGKTVRGCGDEK